MHAMKEALQKRREKGIDLTIIVGPSSQDDAKPVAHLANTLPQHPNHESDLKNKVANELLTKHGVEGSDEEEMSESPEEAQAEGDEVKQAVLGKMSDHDKMMLTSKKPKSLMERAKLAAMGK